MQNTWKVTETLAHRYSSKSTQQGLSNEWKVETEQDLDVFQKELCPQVLNVSSHSIGKLDILLYNPSLWVYFYQMIPKGGIIINELPI